MIRVGDGSDEEDEEWELSMEESKRKFASFFNFLSSCHSSGECFSEGFKNFAESEEMRSRSY